MGTAFETAGRPAADWCDEALDACIRRQLTPGWCVPACLAMLFHGGDERGERDAARALGLDVPEPHALDLRDGTSYARLCRELGARGMRELFAPRDRARLTCAWLRCLRRPALVSVGYHAVICTGCRAASAATGREARPAWRVLDPGNGRIDWRPLPQPGLALQFAFA